ISYTNDTEDDLHITLYQINQASQTIVVEPNNTGTFNNVLPGTYGLSIFLENSGIYFQQVTIENRCFELDINALSSVICNGDNLTLTAVPDPSTPPFIGGTYIYTWSLDANFINNNFDNNAGTTV